MRYLARAVSAEEYDVAVQRWPEMCPLYYMGDRRTGQQLLDDFDSDAGVSVSVALSPACPAAMSDEEGSDGVQERRAGLLERIGTVVTELAAFLASTEPAALSYAAWARAVRNKTTAFRCALFASVLECFFWWRRD